MAFIPYPIQFKPIYKSRIWGGTLLPETYGRKLPPSTPLIGESWEIVDRDDATSVVQNGPYAGHTLTDLMHDFRTEILGQNSSETRFPLLFKIIDAGELLSLQVHPPKEICAQLGNGAEPKTEMWYILNRKPEAEILAGFKTPLAPEDLLNAVRDGSIRDALQIYKPQNCDAFFIESGLVHAIGKGNLIFEIQQNSDTTYRLSDWGRTDAQGNPRELHVKEGLASLKPNLKCVYKSGSEQCNPRTVSAPNPFFEVTEAFITEITPLKTHGGAHVITAVDLPITIRYNTGETVSMSGGESVLIPAVLNNFEIIPSAPSTFLDTACRPSPTLESANIS